MGISSTVTFKDSVTLNFLLRVSRNNIEVKLKKIFYVLLVSCIGLTIIISCKKNDDDITENTTTTDTTAPILAEVTAVTTPTTDTTPAYTFSSTEAGTITYGGSCTSSTTSASSGNNSITFSTLSDGTYDNCTVMVTDNASNSSIPLEITTFTVNDFSFSSSAADNALLLLVRPISTS